MRGIDILDEIKQKSEKREEIDLSYKEKLDYINSCKTMFEFFKEGQDANLSFYVTNVLGGGFDRLYQIFDEQVQRQKSAGNPVKNPEELKKYLKLKENVIENVKLYKGKTFRDYEIYSQNDSVKQLFDFTMNSTVREDTMREESKFLVDVYNEMVKEVVKEDKDAVTLYNTYAKRFGCDICKVPIEHEEQSNEEDKSKENHEDDNER